MPEPVIHIDTIRWELNTSSVDKARFWQDEVSRFTNGALPGIIQQSVNGRVHEEEDVVIPLIELELPALHNPDDIAAIFEAKWREAVEEKLLVLSLAKQGVITLAEENRLSLPEQFMYYLQQGQLQWYSDRSLFADSTAMYNRLMSVQHAILSALADETLRYTLAFRRLVNYFSEEQVYELLRRSGRLSPGMEELLIAADNWLAQHLPGWRKHPGRLLVVFSMVRVSVVDPSFVTARKNMVQQWWQQIRTENYFTIKEMEILLQAMKALAAQREEGKTVTSGSKEEMEQLMVEIITGSEKVTINKENGKHSSSVKKQEEEQPAITAHSYFIENAGIILLYPYCKTWFREAGLLNEYNQFDSPVQRMDACRLLQATAFASIDFKEYHLILNKVLCGYLLQSAVYGGVIDMEKVLEQSDERIKEVISSWEKIMSTSAEGFRNSFLLRNGKLTVEDDHYLLRVERKGWDVLLDTFPHPKSIIKLPWMDKPLYTEW